MTRFECISEAVASPAGSGCASRQIPRERDLAELLSILRLGETTAVIAFSRLARACEPAARSLRAIA